MATLTGTTLLTYPDGRTEIYAVWADAIGQFAAIHDTDGQPVIVPEGVAAPHLTPDQLAAALTPPRHPAYDLADKGTAAKPELAERMVKAAALVEAGGVRLTGPETAVVNEYTVTAAACDCKDFEHRAPGGWCKHRLAVRMARALGRVAQPLTEAEDRRAMEAQREQRQAETAARVDRANYEERRRQAQARRDGLGAERWITIAAANGRQTIPESFYRRAHGDPDVLAAAKAEAKASIKQIFGGD